MLEDNEKRKKFLESIKAPTEEQVGGPVDYSNVVLNAKMQAKPKHDIKTDKSK